MNRIFLLAVLAIFSLTGCNARLYVAVPAVTGFRLAIGIDSVTLRKNNCYQVRLSLQNSSGSDVTPALNTDVFIAHRSSFAMYRSERGCYFETSDDASDVFSIAAGTPSTFGYLRVLEVGTQQLVASGKDSSVTTATKEIAATFTHFNPTQGPSNDVSKMVFDSQAEKIYVVGNFNHWDNHFVGKIVRLNSDGSFDPSFNVTGTGFVSAVNDVVPQTDGKLIVIGLFTAYNGVTRNYIARLNSDGTLDTSFNQTGTGVSGTIYSAAIQNDGKIVVVGSFANYNGTARANILRLNSDGTLDTSFTVGTGLSSLAYCVTIQTDGKIVVGGAFTQYNGTARQRVARLNTDGSLDNSFVQTGTGLSSTVSALWIQGDGKILVGGSFANYNATPRNNIARLNTDGSLDTTFATTGTGLNNGVSTIAVDSNDQVLVGGFFTQYNGIARNGLARLDPAGALDTSLVATGAGFTGGTQVKSVAVHTDGRILASSNHFKYDGIAQRYVTGLNPDGSLDANWPKTDSAFDGDISATALQPDGKILGSGNFSNYAGTPRRFIARVNPDGTLDPTFATTGTGFNVQPAAMVVQPDGKILVSGSFTTYNGASKTGFVRLNEDGSLDAGFSLPGTGFTGGSPRSIALQSDGRIVLGGSFTGFNGTPKAYLLRLNSDGSLDTSFTQTGTGIGGGGSVNVVALRPNGKILVGGLFTNYNGVSRGSIAQFNSDGTLDTSFVPTGSGFNAVVLATLPLSDGKATVVGGFTTFNGTSQRYVARLQPDGSLDSSLAVVGTGFNSSVSRATLAHDGGVLVGGTFTSYDGTPRSNFAKLNPDGTLNNDFGAGSGFAAGQVTMLATQPDGRILVGGFFRAYDDTTAPFFVRFMPSGELD